MPHHIPEFSFRTKPSTAQGMALYERAEADYPEPFRSETMATIHLIEKEARAGHSRPTPSSMTGGVQSEKEPK